MTIKFLTDTFLAGKLAPCTLKQLPFVLFSAHKRVAWSTHLSGGKHVLASVRDEATGLFAKDARVSVVFSPKDVDPAFGHTSHLRISFVGNSDGNFVIPWLTYLIRSNSSAKGKALTSWQLCPMLPMPAPKLIVGIQCAAFADLKFTA